MGRTPRVQRGRRPRWKSQGPRASRQHLGPRGWSAGGPRPVRAVFLSVGLRRNWRKNDVFTFRKNIKDQGGAMWSTYGGLRRPGLPKHVSQDFPPSLFVQPRPTPTHILFFSFFLPKWRERRARVTGASCVRWRLQGDRSTRPFWTCLSGKGLWGWQIRDSPRTQRRSSRSLLPFTCKSG